MTGEEKRGERSGGEGTSGEMWGEGGDKIRGEEITGEERKQDKIR